MCRPHTACFLLLQKKRKKTSYPSKIKRKNSTLTEPAVAVLVKLPVGTEADRSTGRKLPQHGAGGAVIALLCNICDTT